MKFLFVGTNPEDSGAATHFVALAQAMAEAGNEVGVVACPGGLIAEELSHSNVKVYLATFRNAFDVRGYVNVLAAARKMHPDWLVGNFGKEYWPLVVIGRLLRVPVALFRHRTTPMKRLSAYLFPRLAKRFIAVSDYARQGYLEQGIPAHLVRMLYNPVNMAQYKPDEEKREAIRRALGLDPDAIVLGYVGRMHGRKGVLPLLEAASQAMLREPRLHCLWIGDGPETQALRARAATDPQCTRHHFVSWTHDVHPYYGVMSMLAFPSIAPETFGRVSVEAQASGVPVLASDIGGIPETLDAGVTGLLLPPDDVVAWRDAILQMCDPSRRLPMGANSREFVQKHFSTPVIAAEFTRMLVGDEVTISPSTPTDAYLCAVAADERLSHEHFGA
jgi:glycosyltransferase involved in cell wall biosynthesis